MVVWIALRQLKRLAPMSVLVHVGKEWTSKGAVVSPAAHNQPTSVARPSVIALCVVTIDNGQRMCVTRL